MRLELVPASTWPQKAERGGSSGGSRQERRQGMASHTGVTGDQTVLHCQQWALGTGGCDATGVVVAADA